MIGGAPIGGGDIGSFPIDNFVYGARPAGLGLGGVQIAPSYSFTITPPGMGLGASPHDWFVTAFTVPAGLGMGSAEIESSVVGSIEFGVDPAGLGLGSPELTGDVILQGVPEFYVNRAGTEVTITVTNRDQETVRLFRADEFGSIYSEITSFANDTYVDTVPSATANYKYKLAWYVPVGPIIGRKTPEGAYTKHE